MHPARRQFCAQCGPRQKSSSKRTNSFFSCDNEPGKYLNVNETNEHRHKRHPHRRHRSVDNSTVVTDGSTSDHEHVESSTAESESIEERKENKKNQHKQREHHKAEFHAFIQKHFGKSGKHFAKCMNSCSHRFQKPGNCPRKLKCGTKRVPADEWKEATAACDKKKKPRRYETCDCLEKAGVKNLDCTFGGRRENDNTEE
uniref:CxC6 domain-containing protein n=1 Tax=Bursaphelenchus xylophilus TaxID=6326 RepID=A0A1I7SI29_BURXY